MTAAVGGPAEGAPGLEPGAGSVHAPGDEARALLEAVFEASAAGLAILSGPDLRFAKVNPAYRAAIPHPEVDPVGRTFGEVWPGPDPRLAEAIRTTLETGEPFHREDLPLAAGGPPRRFSVHAKRVSFAGKDALLLAAWETTVSWEARRRAEEAAESALRKAAELDAVIDAIADGFVLFGPRAEVLRLNAAAARYLALAGAGPDTGFAELMQRLEVRTPEGRGVTWDEGPIGRALSGETVLGAHLHVAVPGGPAAWMLASAAPVRAPGGAVAGAVLTFADETELRELEDARDDLVRMISHDLRTPLSAVFGHARLLERAPGDTARVVERARAIVRSCERMSGMIQDLVESTLLEAGQLVLERAPVDLAAVVPELLARLRGGLEVDRVAVDIAPGVPTVLADPPRLERVLVNLLSNALKYSPPQSAVRLEIGGASDGGVLLTVSDRGVGIAPEDQPHVFERFFRARGARRPEGLGLGLYITRLLVEAHGGRVEVESALGQGSTFRVHLPPRPVR